MSEIQNEQLNDEEKSLLNSVSTGKILIPVVLGLGAVFYLLKSQFNFSQLDAINWSKSTFWWLLVSVIFYVFRHICYSWRLMCMTDNFFSFKKAFELIVIWNFSSAISPTSIGGSGVALLLLSQEKLSAAKTIAVVTYSIVLDTIILVFLLPLLILIFGLGIVQPGMTSIGEPFGLYSILVLAFMTVYGFLFYYGIFVNPSSVKNILKWFGNRKIFKRWKSSLDKTAEEIVIAAHEIKTKDSRFHRLNMLYTTGAWVFKFLTLNAIILALIPDNAKSIYDQLIIFSRGVSMYVISSFIPTPGGSGFAEYLFGSFFSDYIPKGIAGIVALIWRLITYYPYLVLGAVIIPIWLRGIIRERRASTSAEQ